MIFSYIEFYGEEKSGRSAFSYRTCLLCGRDWNRNIVSFVFGWTVAAVSLFLIIGHGYLLPRLRRYQGGDCFIGRTFFIISVVSSADPLFSDYRRWIYDNTKLAQVRFSMDTWMEISSMVLIWCCYYNWLQFPHKKYASADMGDYNVKCKLSQQIRSAIWQIRCALQEEYRKEGERI